MAGIAPPAPVPDFTRYKSWIDRGLAGEMGYLSDHRADLRNRPSDLLPGVRSVICTATSYNGPRPESPEFTGSELGSIARYAWGEDYHSVIRVKLELLASKLLEYKDFQWRACVDTAPLLERSFATRAGLGWIGKNTFLINQQHGSFTLLGELLTTLEIEGDTPAPDRCGTCQRCIEACPTDAIVPSPDGRYELDARLCISYFTIESRQTIPAEHRQAIGQNVFGCDICQDVCPWNRKAEPAPTEAAPPVQSLQRMAALTQVEFRQLFRSTAVSRAKYATFLRNVAVAMGNAALPQFRPPLEKLAASEDPLVSEHARWALSRIGIATS